MQNGSCRQEAHRASATALPRRCILQRPSLASAIHAGTQESTSPQIPNKGRDCRRNPSAHTANDWKPCSHIPGISPKRFLWLQQVSAAKSKPLTGYGWDYVAGAYGAAQERYFSKGDYTEQEEHVAGSPEYVFNEYFQTAMAWGVPVLCVILLLVIVAMTGHHVSGNYGLFGSMLSLAVFSFSSYPFQFPLFVAAFGLLVLTGLSGWLRFFPIALLFPVGLCWCAGIYGGYMYFTHVQEREAVKNRWQRVRMFYHSGAYTEAVESYKPFYEKMGWNARYLFELGHACHKAGKHEESNRYLKEALKVSGDPMILNIMGKNCQVEKRYQEAEHYLLRSVNRLPGRIYPYYLLFKLYDEMPEGKYVQERKEWAARMVLEKEPKVQSTAIREMREEVKKRINLK